MITDDREAARKRVQDLRSALGGAYSAMTCMKALAMCDNDMQRSADWLTDGKWLQSVMATFDHVSLATKAQALSLEARRPLDECLTVLKHCAGSVDLARRKLAGVPVIDPGAAT